MSTDGQQLVETKKLACDEISAKTRQIYKTVLSGSPYLEGGNFTVAHPDDLRRLFDEYDGAFFDGNCRRLLGTKPLEFRFSKRMTRSAGKTGRHQLRHRNGTILETRFEIAISSAILYESFRDEGQSAVVNGIECGDRLEALQRVMEHEMVHLIEMLLWGHSSCAARRFQSIAERFFGHTEHAHHLVTPRQRALREFGIQPGDQVSFRFEGRQCVGIVNRITKRATVLVEDKLGERYSDGKCYKKFYVPVRMLERVVP